MLKPLLASALFAGLIAGLFGAALHLLMVVPLIHEAELYESGALSHFGGDVAAVEGHEHAEGIGAHEHGEGDDGLWRGVFTTLTVLLSFCGFALILVAGFAAAERAGLTEVSLKRGLLWGLAGFAAFQLMPAMGLPPELPGSGAAALEDRQTWWLMTVAATAIGLGLIAFGHATLVQIAGAVLLALPHLIGAPEPMHHTGVAPPELAGLFAARALGVGALTWLVLGAAAGHLWSRERPAT